MFRFLSKAVYRGSTSFNPRRCYRNEPAGVRWGLEDEPEEDWEPYTKGVPPPAVDWRRRGVVTPVKQQGHTGACWSFGTVAAVESLLAIKTNRLVCLSVQQILDCEPHCCGIEGSVYKYIKKKGLTTEKNYPFTAENQECQKALIKPPILKTSGYERVAPYSMASLVRAVARQPVVVGVCVGAYDPLFQSYLGGLFQHDFHGPPNHIMTLVGYGRTPEGEKCWILKNSYGKLWGDCGYMYLLREEGRQRGLCGITLCASYPTMTDDLAWENKEKISELPPIRQLSSSDSDDDKIWHLSDQEELANWKDE